MPRRRRGPSAVLLDTDVFSYTGRKGHSVGGLYLRHLRDRVLALTFVTVGEALSGARGRGWSEARLAELHARFRRFVVVPFDLQVCEQYAELGGLKTAQGSNRVIHANDRWIAACALRHGLPLVTHNRRHVEGIPGLVLISEAASSSAPGDRPLPLQ